MRFLSHKNLFCFFFNYYIIILVIFMLKDNENVLYGKSLQNIRKKNNLTQDEVAQLTGLDTKYISQIETR